MVICSCLIYNEGMVKLIPFNQASIASFTGNPKHY